LLALDYFRAVELSPDGRYISYIRTPEPDAELAGLWILDTLTLTTNKMNLSGSYAWHPSSRGLIVIPARAPDEDDHQLWWVDVDGSPPVPLTDPALIPLAISNFEWELSPDGRKIAYRAARHLAVWVLDFGLAFDTLVPDSASASSQSVE
jgi:transglutaminase-like putative cysteine protease